jgi:hypothetical protein
VVCRSPDDCPFGSYCVLDVDGARFSGTCVQDCLEHDDCPAPASAASRAICTNRGRCAVVPRIPRLRLRLPEPEQTFPEGTRFVRVSGEVETAADRVRIQARAVGTVDCPGAPPTTLRLENGTGAFQTLPFTVDRIPVEPSTRSIGVEADVGGAQRRVEIPIRVACPGCATVALEQPPARASAPGLVLETGLAGRVDPPVPVALWRVRGVRGGVFDGRLEPDAAGRFDVDRLPIFSGASLVEVAVSGVGEGAGESRCTTYVQSAAQDRGLRVVMTWDTAPTDMDLHLVGPSGRFRDPMTALSPATPSPAFGGRIRDDFDGFGPEVLASEVLPDGTYGLIVEPVVGAGTVTVRILNDGAPVTVGPVGPVYLAAARAELWVAGTLEVRGGEVTWRPLGDRLSLGAAPLTPPPQWPMYR